MILQIAKKNRYELKFITYDIYYYNLLNWVKIHDYAFKREYNTRIVNNVYFDSYYYDSYRDNIYGSSSRTKVRYRWYGEFNRPTLGSLEIKYKRNIFGWKQRYNINKFSLSSEYTWKEIYSLFHNNIPLKGKIWLEKNPIPTIINQYLRDYFISSNNKIRITVDRNLFVYDQRYSLFPNIKKKTLTQPVVIVEFKFNRENRDEAEELFGNMPIRGSRNSKYVNCIRAVTGI